MNTLTNLDLFDSKIINENLVMNLPYDFFSKSGTSDKIYSIVGKAPRTKKDFMLLTSIFFDGFIPAVHNNKCDCIDHSLQIDAIWDAYCEIEDFLIWYAARGTGKTYDLAWLAFTETIYKPKCKTSIIGGSLEQAMRAVAYFNEFWDKDFFLNKEFLINKQISGRGFKTIRGSWVKALAASPKSIRGEHPQKLRIDEADELERKLYDASLGQPKSNDGHKDNIIVSSTLHNPFGLMSEILDERETIGAKLYKWCIDDVTWPFGFWSLDEVERKRRQVPEAMWDSEYKCKRPKIGDSIFDFEKVEKSYRRGINIIFSNELINTAGVDWGYTCTALNVIQDVREKINIPFSFAWEQVELNDRCNEIIEVCIDKNINIIYCDSSPKDNVITLRSLIKKKRKNIAVIPIVFNVWKTIGIDVIRYYLERDLINIKSKVLQDKMKKYHYKDAEKEVIDKVDDHYVDALIAWAATRWRILSYLRDEEKRRIEKQETRMLKFNVGIGG